MFDTAQTGIISSVMILRPFSQKNGGLFANLFLRWLLCR
jgi:hypothetical protein